MAYDKQAVANYHSRLKDMKIRFYKADEELGIPDYSEIIKEQANKLGKSANEYILDLIENDIRTNEDGINEPDFSILRDIKKLKNE